MLIIKTASLTNGTFFLSDVTLEDIIDHVIPYFGDLHRNENYMDTQPNREDDQMITTKLSYTGRQRDSVMTHRHRKMKQKEDNGINPHME